MVIKKPTAAALLVTLGFVAYWAVAYHTWEFRGAGPIKDTGLFSYYRYHAPLGEFPLAAKGSYTFRFSGLPREKMG